MLRLAAIIVFVGSIVTSAWYRRRARQATGTIRRTSEPAALIAGRLSIALPLFGGTVLYLAHPALMGWSSFPVPEWMRWIGVGLGIAVMPGIAWVLQSLGSNVSETVLTKTDHELVTWGPYRWIRHPLYTVGILLFLSMGLIAANWFILLFAVLAALAVRMFVIPREEEELTARFGTEYERYRARTNAMIPGIGRSR